LALGNNSRVTLLPNGQTSLITSLTLGTGATLDLGNNAVVVDYTGASPVSTIRQQILSGRGGPGLPGLGAGWNGTGITSSAVAQANATEPESRSIGYAENAALPLGAYTTFRGVAVDNTSVLIVDTRTGDANLDGLVNDDDVTVLGASYSPTAANAVWALGDFEYNGFVDDDDATLLGAFYNPAAPAPAPARIPVLARSPDRATFSTEGLPAIKETFGQFAVRGQEIRAQLGSRQLDDAVELIAGERSQFTQADALVERPIRAADHKAANEEFWAKTWIGEHT
jgi:hypothetical protein